MGMLFEAQRRISEISNFAGTTEPTVVRPESGVKIVVIIVLVLSRRYVFRLRALGAIGNSHGYALTLLKSLVPFALYRAVMNENVFATLL